MRRFVLSFASLFLLPFACATARPEPAPPPALSRCNWTVAYVGGIGIELHVPRTLEQLAGGTLTLCRHDACASATVPPPVDGMLHFEVPPASRTDRSYLAHGWSAADTWSVLIAFRAIQHPVDGDAYRVFLSDGAGRPLIDVERRVAYKTDYPLGPECPDRRTTGAGMTLWPTSKSGLTCGGEGCDSRVELVGHIVDVTRLYGAQIEICRGATCARDTFPVARGSDSKLFGGVGMAVGAFSSDHTFTPGFAVMPDRPGGPWTYRATISGEPAAMANGDRYSFTLKAADGSVIATFARAVTYEESRPNGPECDAYACKNATIEVE